MDLEPIDIVFDGDQTDISNQAIGSRDNPTFFISPPITDCIGVSLLYASVPFTYHVIDQTCNAFEFTGDSLGPTICTLASGTYNSQNFPNAFLAALGAGGFTASNYGVEVDNTDMKLTVWRAAGSGTFTINFNVGNSAFRSLGFMQTSYTSTTTPYFDNNETLRSWQNIRSPRVVNFTGPGQMFLSSDFGSNLFGKVRNQTSNSPLVGFWSVNANYTGTIEANKDNPERIPISKSDVSTVKLKLLLGNRNLYQTPLTSGLVDYLPLNGESFQVALRFYRLISSEKVTNDAMGNSSTTLTNNLKSSVYQPMQLQQKDLFSIRRTAATPSQQPNITRRKVG